MGSEDGDERAVVYVRFVENHPERGVLAGVSVGERWGGTSPENRTAFSLDFRNDPESYGVMVRDADVSPWREVPIPGRMLDREEALAHPALPDVFHITDHLFAEDEALLACFAGAANG